MNTLKPVKLDSTYTMIVRSEEKQRSRFETLVFSILIATAFFAVSQLI